jgi:hypothetical protein
MDEIKADRHRYEQLEQRYTQALNSKEHYMDILSMVTSALAALQWHKDENFKYTVANHSYCNRFFGVMSKERCISSLQGRTDEEVVQMFYPNEEVTNTLVASSAASDAYMHEMKEPAHFFLTGTIDDVYTLMYVIKKPTYSGTGLYTGCSNLGWDLTSRTEELQPALEVLMSEEQSSVIYEDSFTQCILVNPELTQCGLFQHLCVDKVIERARFCLNPDSCDKDCERKNSVTL